MPNLKPDRAQIEAQLHANFDDVPTEFEDGLVEIAYGVADVAQAHLFEFGELGEAARFAHDTALKGNNVYCGVALRKPDTARDKRTTDDDAYAAGRLWFDVDAKLPGVKARLGELDIGVACTVRTGTTPEMRAQGQIKLDAWTDDLEEIATANELLARAIGADPAVANIGRVMRLGGTVNFPKAVKRKRGYIAEQTQFKPKTDPKTHDLNGLITKLREATANGEDKMGDAMGSSERVDLEAEIAICKANEGGWHQAMKRIFGHLFAKGWKAGPVTEFLRKAGAIPDGLDADYAALLAWVVAKQPGIADAQPSPPEEGEESDEDADVALAKAALEEAAVLADLNERHFIVREGSKIVVYSPRYDPILRRWTIDGMGRADFAAMYENRVVPRVRKNKNGQKEITYQPWARFWLTHRARRQYLDGVCCDPTNTIAAKGHFNLWRGFGVEAKAGDWALMRRHILEVICSSDQAHFAYVMGWLSFAVKHPETLPEVALVLCGGRGTGKGILGRALVRIFGQHGIHITNAKHLVGNFNNHLRDVIFCFADEAFFAGDKTHESVLKGLITEPTIGIEAKYRDRIEVPNMIHPLMASNDTWVVPAGHDERRFAVLKISDARQGDHAYFKAIVGQMEGGGYEAMLHDLLAHDLTGFQIRDVPQTKALMDNKASSLTGAPAWLYDVLQRGYIDGEPTVDTGSRDNRIILYDQSPNITAKADAFHDFTKYQRQYRSYALPLNLFMRDLYAIEARAIVRPFKARDGETRTPSVLIAPLNNARAHFARFMKSDITWDDE